jgi:RHS repeat-associated protein
LTNPALVTVTRSYTDPFGIPRNTPTPPLVGDHGFLSKPADTTGYTSIGARYYNPATGTFISVDPLLDLMDIQQWNSYGYASNNPLTWADPTGQWKWLDDHWRSIAAGVVVAVVIVGVVACTAATVGACAGIAVAVGAGMAAGGGTALATTAAVGAAGGALSAAGAYAFLGDDGEGNYSARGAQHAVAAGAIGGAGGAVIGAAVGGAAATGASLFTRLNAANTATQTAARASAATQAASTTRACQNSFDAGTLVLMADGTFKQIEDVQQGDSVVSFDTTTGTKGSDRVIGLIRHGGTHLWVRLQLSDGSEVDSTDRHPIWSKNREDWINAIELLPGDQVQTVDGKTVFVLRTSIQTRVTSAYNLTVENRHTYYVGTAKFLVHNAICGLWDVDALSASGSRSSIGGLTQAGRKLSQHGGQGALPRVSGAPSNINRLGQHQLDDILTNPKTIIRPITGGQFRGGRYYITPDGRGAAFDSRGVFQYFGTFKK